MSTWPTPEAPQSPSYGRDADYSVEYQAREAELWQDLEILSELIRDAKALEYRGVRRGDNYHHPAVRIGTPALTAFRDGDAHEFYRLIRAEVDKEIRDRAETEIDDEKDPL